MRFSNDDIDSSGIASKMSGRLQTPGAEMEGINNRNAFNAELRGEVGKGIDLFEKSEGVYLRKDDGSKIGGAIFGGGTQGGEVNGSSVGIDGNGAEFGLGFLRERKEDFEVAGVEGFGNQGGGFTSGHPN